MTKETTLALGLRGRATAGDAGLAVKSGSLRLGNLIMGACRRTGLALATEKHRESVTGS